MSLREARPLQSPETSTSSSRRLASNSWLSPTPVSSPLLLRLAHPVYVSSRQGIPTREVRNLSNAREAIEVSRRFSLDASPPRADWIEREKCSRKEGLHWRSIPSPRC